MKWTAAERNDSKACHEQTTLQSTRTPHLAPIN
jgi:hypothetical protein